MGNTESKKNSFVLSANTHNFVYKKNYQLTKNDYSYLCNETKQSVEQIDKIFDDFFDTNKKGILEKKDFIELYCNLRKEPQDKLSDIADMAFKIFDKNNDGYISVKEFIIGFAITNNGDIDKKLEYAFMLYDRDNSGYLDKTEVLHSIQTMLKFQDDKKDYHQLAEECFESLDKSKNGRVSKQEFINGLKYNQTLRSILNPFQK